MQEPVKICVLVEGGLVVGVWSALANIDVKVLDLDDNPECEDDSEQLDKGEYPHPVY
jgi:hypothetical protein